MAIENMKWQTLLSSARLGDERAENDLSYGRTAFQRDFDRVVFSSAFRRLQDKTQVFPVPASDFVHSRLTHSIEVSSVGRTLGNIAGEWVLQQHADLQSFGLMSSVFGDIVAAASLAHDVGNPPFGHSGEDAISEFFTKNESILRKPDFSMAQWNDFVKYEGNAHGFRLLTNHHPGQLTGGLRLTMAVLATFAKYPRESFVPSEAISNSEVKRVSAKKFNFFQNEKQSFTEVAEVTGLLKLTKADSGFAAWSRHPLSFLVEAADNICYRLIDLEDGYKLNFIGFKEVEELLIPFMRQASDSRSSLAKYDKITDRGEKIGYLRAKAISVLITESIDVFKQNYGSIMSADFDDELTNHIASRKLLEEEIKQANLFLYNQKPVIEIEITGFKIISGLLQIYIEAQYDQKSKLNKKLINQLPEQFRASAEDTDYEVLMKTVDYVARMSDSYALNLYRRITGQKLPVIG